MKTTILYTATSILIVIFIAGSTKTNAQTAVLQFQANYVAASSSVSSYSAFPNSPGTFSSCTGTSYSYTWSNGSSNELKLVSFTANSKNYVVAGIPGVQVKLRRVNNANVTGNRSIMYSETTAASANSCPSGGQLNFKAPYCDDMATFLNNNVLNRGTDNLFTNASNGDGNNNNIERVDVVFPIGISSSLPADAGFILCERGNNYAHDGFRIAAILSIDGSDNPTSFGSAKTCTPGNGLNNGSWGHPSIANGNKLLAAYVLRKDAADTYLKVSSNVNQEIGGVFFSLSNLGVAANQVIYGYALIGPDGIANPTSAQLLTTSDATVYPTTTTEAVGGGLDLISINTFFGTDQALASGSISFFSGNIQQEDAVLNWQLQQLQNESMVTLERSDNGIAFSPVFIYHYDEQVAEKTFRDNITNGTYYYRLKIETIAGTINYSRIIILQLNQQPGWKLYPSITTADEPIIIEGLPDGNYEAILQGLAARLHKIKITIRSGKGVIDLSGKILSSGTYLVIIEKDGKPAGKSNKIIIRNF